MPTTPIFVDTSFIVALINERDQYHEPAVELADRYDGQPLILTNSILLEVANALSRRYKQEAIQIIDEFLSSENVEIIHMTVELFQRGFELYKTRQDKTWGLVDCISFLVMHDRNLPIALTFDQHFLQAGFQIPPLTK